MGGKRRSSPSFFKVLFSEDYAFQLRLPAAFVQQNVEILREKTILRAISGGESWVVKLENFEEFEKCYFTVGWQKFAEDLGLRMGEFMVFWYAAESTFDFSVFGISGCERVISNCKSKFVEISCESDDEEVQVSSEDYVAFAKRKNHADMSDKRARKSSDSDEEDQISSEDYAFTKRHMSKKRAGTSSDSDEEDQISSEDSAFTKLRNRACKSKKRAGASIYEKEATRNNRGNADRVSPLYFEKVLKEYHRSRVTLPMEFGNSSGLIKQKCVVLEYVPKRHFSSATLNLRFSRLDMSWNRFIKENGLVFGRSYSFEFNPRTKVIQVDEIKR